MLLSHDSTVKIINKEEYEKILDKQSELSAFLGMSICHPYYSNKDVIKQYMEFMAGFKKGTFFIVDLPYRHTFCVRNKMSYALAEHKCIRIGKELETDIRGLVEKSQQKSRFNVLTHTSLAKKPDYSVLLNSIEERISSCNYLDKLLTQELYYYPSWIRKFLHELDHQKRKECEELLRKFVLEEITAFILLYEDYDVRISKYCQRPILNELNADGLFINAIAEVKHEKDCPS